MKYKFPENFWWGSASSAPQMEGSSDVDGKAPNILDKWYDIEPTRFFDGVGPQDTSDFYRQYKTDIALMKEIGHNSFRTSISWSRLIPSGGKGAPNPKAVAFYNDVIDTMLENGIKPFMNLFHFDMPLIEQEKGGWESREVVENYVHFAKTCFELFGDRVKHWFTHNEPIVPVLGGYLDDFLYPNVLDCVKAMQVLHNSNMSSARAIEEFKKLNIKDAQIGIILNLSAHYPRSQHPYDLRATEIAELFYSHSFLGPAIKGEYPEELLALWKQYGVMPQIEENDYEIMKENTVQILGVNYYQPHRIKAKEYVPHPNSPFKPTHLFDHYEMPGRRMNPYRGWEIYPRGIYDLSITIRDKYGNIPFFIAENGMGVENEARFLENGQIQDDYRITFVRDHLIYLHKAIEEGCNCLGYHLWTFIDNWSWSNAYKNRYGYLSLDLKTQKRTLKKSAYWIKEVSAANGFN